jgi:hypothetical protein
MYVTYAYEALKAIATTLVFEWNFKGTALVMKGIIDGMKGRGGMA